MSGRKEQRLAVQETVAGQWRLSRMLRALKTWEQTMVDLQQRQILEDKMRKKVIRRMLYGALAAALEQWQQNAREKRLMAAKVLKAISCWRNRAVASCMHVWEFVVASERYGKIKAGCSKVEKSITCGVHDGLASALSE